MRFLIEPLREMGILGVMMAFLLFMLIAAFGTGVSLGRESGIAEGRSMGIKEALKTNPISEQLEMVCAGLWVGEQNKKYWKKENDKANRQR